MRRNVVSCATILWLALCFAAQASTVPLLVPHQGRLLDDNDAPVSGMRALTFALYEAPAGGVALWTELHGAVMIEDGLFTVSLGSVTPLSQDLLSPPSAPPPFERYLEVRVDGVALTPRIRLATVPYSMTSTRVDGDVVTAPGELHMSSLGGSTTGTIRTSTDSAGYSFSTGGASTVSSWTSANTAIVSVSNAPGLKGIATSSTASKSSITMLEGGLESASLESTDDSTRLLLSSRRQGDAFVNQFQCELSKDITRVSLDSDSDGDGEPESGMEFTARSKQSESKSNTKAAFTAQSRMFSDTASGGMETSLDLDNDGTPEVSSSNESTASGSVSRWIGRTGSTTGTIRMMASPDSTVEVIDADSDDDGLCDAQVVVRVTPSDGLADGEGSIMVSTDHAAGGPRQSVSLDGSSSHARTVCVSDLDRDGIDDVVVASSSSATGAVSNWYVDSDDDGVPESSMELQCSPGGTSSKAIQTKGSGAIASVRSSTPLAADSGATLVLDYDDDGDGVSTFRLVDRAEPVLVSSTMEADTDDDGLGDNIIEAKVTPTMCSHSITTKGTGAQAGRIFLDGSRSQDDGVIKNFLWQQVSGPGGFVTEREVSMDIDSGGSSMSISNADGTRGQITARSGMSGSTTATIRMATSVDSGVVDYLDYDDDGDGIAEHTVRVTARDAYGNTMVSSDSDDDGVSDFSIESRCDPTKSTLKVDGDLTVGTGSLEFTVGNTAPELRVTQDGTDRCVVRSDSGVQLFDDLGAKTVHLSTGGTVTVSGSLSLGSVASSHFIDVQGGAYCDGTDWVNASDAASKENFRAVDGADLLKQIADLEISRWNYKGQDNVEHIGPTAQDFQAAFGVGANDKSISTIDPSGIALAAIKELQRQNQELAGQNDALRGELESLRREVRALAATR